MEITKKLVAEVKRHNKLSWHDQSWHDFEARPEVEAINFAMMDEKNIDDIIISAENYLKNCYYDHYIYNCK